MAAVTLDLARPRRIHVVGAGGSGMSALATVLAAMGHHVSGSDVVGTARLDRLRDHGIEVWIGHAPERAMGAEVVTASSAVPADDPEIRAARAAGRPVLRRAEVLGAICATRRTIAVGGTHGKTTTTAMLAWVLVEAGREPSFLVGGEVSGLGDGASWGGGEWFVVEADESDGTFVELGAEGVVVTSVEPDHLDYHGSYRALLGAFGSFLASAPGPRVVCIDDAGAAELARETPCRTYGTSESAEYRLDRVRSDRDGVTFTVSHRGVELGSARVSLPGLHNARNAAAAIVSALALGERFDVAVAALGRFEGVARRFERRGVAGGVTFVDEYAHLPTEVAASLAAARQGGWRRVVCAFQPHRYTRTAALWRDFGPAFADADVVAVTEVYPAGQDPLPGVTGKLIVDAVLDALPGKRVAWLPSQHDLVAYLGGELRAGDLCLTLGAGDLTSLPDQLKALVEERPR
ncbi:MAG: UDP-N-acetylmuramate--L-alanine ligase [Acidimicrobiales bacterium]